MEASSENQVTDSIGAGNTGQAGGKQSRIQKMWLRRLRFERKCHKDWRDRARKIEEIWRKKHDEELYIPIWWECVNISHVGCYSNQPVPDVRPRNEAHNPTMRKVAKVIQRALAYCTDQPSFDANMHRAVDDYLAISLGTCRIKIDSIISKDTQKVPVFENQVVGYSDPADPYSAPITQQVQTGTREETSETIGDQWVRWEFVPWNCFGWQPCNNWKDCDWVFFKHPMTQKEIIERFGRPVSATKRDRDKQDPNKWQAKTYDIYEIWCKSKREVLFIAEGESEPLETIKDPLELKDFFPCPEPMMMNLPSDELIPQSDYDYIEPYDVELNDLQERRMALLQQIRAAGAYDPGLPELGDMLENEDGEYTAVANLQQRAAAVGGIDGILMHLPIEEKARVLQVLTEQIASVRAQVDEILGISDIVRGVTAASETATAQEIKGRWVGVRLTRKRETVQYYVRDMMRIMAQVLGSHITPENLQRMTQMQLSEQEMMLLTDDVLMEFAVDIETDSTVAKDEFREMQTKQEMLNGVAQYSQAVLPMVAQNQMPSGVASAILRSALAPYTKYDRNLEEELGSLPQTMQQLQGLNQQLQQSQQQLQQFQMQAQQWEQVARDLQAKATAASTEQKMADAGKKKAETAEIVEGLDVAGEHAEVDVDLKVAQTIDTLARADSYNNGAGNGNPQ